MTEQAQHAIDLTRHAFVFHIQDLSLYGSWIFNADQEDYEPALVLIPRYRARGFAPVVIALSAAWKYDNPRYLAQVSPTFVRALGFEDNLANGYKVAEIIYGHLDDLVKMMPNPTSRIIVGEARIEAGHGRTRKIEISDFVSTPQA